MAIFHLSVKPICRSAGRSATAAAAYRAGCKVVDQRTGEIHDYRRRRGVESTHIILPTGAPAWASDRSKLWNQAEASEKRKDGCVGREIVVALPVELDQVERQKLTIDFARSMVDDEGCAIDIAIHSPSKNGDDRNFHAHILRTTRRLEKDGLGEKLASEKSGRNRVADLNLLRELWANMANHFLQKKGVDARVDHRSLKVQGSDRNPGKHRGPAGNRIKKRLVDDDAHHDVFKNSKGETERLIQQLKIEIQQEEFLATAPKISIQNLLHANLKVVKPSPLKVEVRQLRKDISNDHTL